MSKKIKIILNFLHGLLCFLFGSALLLGQSQNVQLRSNWDDNSIVEYNDIWGYADNADREYAIIGSRLATHFIDITDPDQPVVVDTEIGGTACSWRDYKTFGHYVYGVSDRCGGGLEIFDLSTLPDSVTKVYDSDTLLRDTHNIFIDTASGRLYACGMDTFDIVVLDLLVNPELPKIIGQIEFTTVDDPLNQGYVHDLYVRNDTAYCSMPNLGSLHVYDLVDLTNVNNLTPIASITTTGYNHSNWLTDDGNTVIVATETHNHPVRILDFSNQQNFTELATIKSTLLAPDFTNSLAHNPFILGNKFAFISYYEDGLQIFRIDSTSMPFKAGYYDTRPEGANYFGYNGAWGAYPYLPSGNIIVSDILNGLFVLTTQFPLSDCQGDVVIEGVYDHYWTFISKDKMTVSAMFQDSARIDLISPDQFTLEGGFSVTSGTHLEAFLRDDCNPPPPPSKNKRKSRP